MEDILEEDVVPSFRVILSNGVAAKIRNGIPRASVAENASLGLPYAGLLEVGGLLMGEDVGENTFRVTEVSLTIGEPYRYYLDPAEHYACLKTFKTQFPDNSRFGLIGSWHSHPSGKPEPSVADLQTLKDMMEHPSTDLAFKVLIIVCPGSGDQLLTGGVVLTQKPRTLSKIEIFIEPTSWHTIEDTLKEDILNTISALGPGEDLPNDKRSSIERTYSAIKEFKVEIRANESQHRGRPHCCVTTDKGAVSVDIRTGEIIAGNAGRWNTSVSKAVVAHSNGLQELWDQMRPDDQRLPTHHSRT